MALQFCDDATQDLEQIWIHWVHDAGVYAKWMNRFLGKPTNAIEIFVTFEWVQFSRMRQTSNSNNNECILYCIWANDARSRVSSVYYNLIVFFFQRFDLGLICSGSKCKCCTEFRWTRMHSTQPICNFIAIRSTWTKTIFMTATELHDFSKFAL